MTKSFEVFKVIRDGESGIIAKLTRRQRHDHFEYSFSIQKEFEREGITESTAYINKRHIDGARRVMDQVELLLDELEDADRAKVRMRRPDPGERVG